MTLDVAQRATINGGAGRAVPLWLTGESANTCKCSAFQGACNQLTHRVPVPGTVAKRSSCFRLQNRYFCSLDGAAVLGGEEADVFDGVGKIAGGACVAPAIVEVVASELEKTEN